MGQWGAPPSGGSTSGGSDRLVAVAPPVLLVEDSATAAALVRQALRATRLRNPLVVASTVAAAAAHLDQGIRPVVVLLDYELPDGNGIDLLRSHGRGPLASTPVIILSAHEGGAEIDEAYRLGAAAYLVKPVGYDAVEDIIRRLRLPWFLGSPDGST